MTTQRTCLIKTVTSVIPDLIGNPGLLLNAHAPGFQPTRERQKNWE